MYIYVYVCVRMCVYVCRDIKNYSYLWRWEEKDDDGTSLYDNYEREKNIRWKFDFVIRYIMKKWRKEEEEVDKKGKKERDDTWREEEGFFFHRFHFFIDLSDVMWFFFFFKYKSYWRQKYEIMSSLVARMKFV